MDWTQSDLDKLRAAAASGIRRVTFADGRSTEYQNLDQLLSAIGTVESALSSQERGTQRRRRTTVLRVGRY